MQEINWLLFKKTGYTTELPLWQEKFILGLGLELDSFPTFMEVLKEEDADLKATIMQAPKSLDGVCNNWKNRNSSRRTRRETD